MRVCRAAVPCCAATSDFAAGRRDEEVDEEAAAPNYAKTSDSAAERCVEKEDADEAAPNGTVTSDPAVANPDEKEDADALASCCAVTSDHTPERCVEKEDADEAAPSGAETSDSAAEGRVENEDSDEAAPGESCDSIASHGFIVGDVLQFVDGVATHRLDCGSSIRYCHEQHVRLLRVGMYSKYDGWLEVRALSWESPERQTDFEARGWVNPRKHLFSFRR